MILDAISQVLFDEAFVFAAQDERTAINRKLQLAETLRHEESAMEGLKSEVIAVIRGTSAFGSVLLNDLIAQTESKIMALKLELEAADKQFHQQRIRWNRLKEVRKSLYDNGTLDVSSLSFTHQKELTALLIERVEIGRGNVVKVFWSFGGTAYLGADAGG